MIEVLCEKETIGEKLKLIYVADDEKNIRNLIKSFLEKEGYLVESFENGDVLYEAFCKKQADMIILDVMMPGSDGFAICSKIRQISTVPMIMVTARDGEGDYIAGMTLGSDDYFTKPFRPLQLSMRVKAIFRRIEMEKGNVVQTKQLSFSDILLLPDQRIVKVKGKELDLTSTELNLLTFLMEHKERAVSREELLNKIWGYHSFVETRVTDDTVKRLRKKLDFAGSTVKIQTVWGFGFKLREEQRNEL